MHRYQPRIHLVRLSQGGTPHITDLDTVDHRSYKFRQTVFTAVTAYQNQLVSITYIISLAWPSLLWT